MKILQLNCVYKEGSTGKIVDCLGAELRRRGHNVFTCYGNGAKYYDEFSERICSTWEHKFNALLGRVRGIPYGGFYISNWRFKRILSSYKPDLVHVHCINGSVINVYDLLKLLAHENIKTVVSLHAEIFHTGGCAHAYECEKWKYGCHDCSVFKKESCSYFFDRSRDCWNKIHDSFQSFKPENLRITAVSPWLEERAKQSDIMKDFEISSVYNGLDPDVFHYRENKCLIDRENYNGILLFVAPYFNMEEGDLKGGKYVTRLAERMPEHKVVVVANRVADGLPKLPSNIQIWGRANGQDELAQLYSEADATVLFSKRETFSMVTAESLCCGTPVVGFKAGGPESIALSQYSHFVEYSDMNALIQKLKSLKNKKLETSRKAIETYSQSVMTDAYLEIYKSLKPET